MVVAVSSLMPQQAVPIRVAQFVWASVMSLLVASLGYRMGRKGWRNLRPWEKQSLVIFSALLPFAWAFFFLD
jgi:hypothetical protein